MPAGAGDPVQTGGTVPGWVAMGSLGEQALSAAAATAIRMAAGVPDPRDLTMSESLTCHQHDHTGCVLGNFG